MNSDEIRKKGDEARARADHDRQLEEARQKAEGIRVIPLQNPERGPKMGSFADDFPDARLTNRPPSQDTDDSDE